MKSYLALLFTAVAVILGICIVLGLIASFIEWSVEPFIKAYEDLSKISTKKWRIFALASIVFTLLFYWAFVAPNNQK